MKVNIINVNDNVPIFNQQLYMFHLEEHSANMTLVGRLGATDQDEGDYGIIRYSINPDNPYFFIHSDNGDIFTKSDIDREIRTFITTEVTATDGGNYRLD